MKAFQQDLFPNLNQEELADPESQVGNSEHVPRFKQWSYSRRDVFEKCQRLYYFLYYGASGRHAKADPQKQRLKFLKKISNRHMRAGSIMHRAISCSLRGRAEGREWSPDFMVDFACKRFQEDLEFSRSYKEGAQLLGDSPALLMEFYYGIPEAEQHCHEVQEKLARALRNFQAGEYLPFRAGVDDGQAKIEHRLSLKHQNVRLLGVVDLAFCKNARATVVDWKMGDGEGGEDSLQLLTYALWAAQTFGCRPDHVDLFKAYLGRGTSCLFDLGPKEIVRATARIAQDVERMRAVDEYGHEGVVDAFSPCGQERVCATCVFQGVCPKE
jgi:hypothetical protein